MKTKLPKSFLSYTGTILCSIYVFITILCVVLALSARSDPKGAFVLLQLPVAPMIAILEGIGVSQFLRNVDWITAYVTFVPATLIMLYATGYTIGSIASFFFR